MAATLQPLNYTTRTDDCYGVIKAGILRLDLTPGSTLDEIDLATQLGVSKTPVREALARLAGEGFVIAPPGRKGRVADLSPELITEVYQVRMLLEAGALRDLTPNLTDPDLKRLQEFVNQTAATLDRDDLPGFVATSEGFHMLLIERTGNHYLAGVARRLFDQADRVRAAIYRTEQRSSHHALTRRGIQNHQAILDALVDRDAERASALLRADIQMFLDAATTPEMQDAFRQIGHPAPGDRSGSLR